ncbi:hypothetical protein A3G63_01930 [Candidatus Kaiserbacteria bacterium RIFCSPLOWO2_12_FULL_52_8]|nr:MAG: hypothetical protein A3G63_01930 [Candidatus Kaiserbacteria bacterium RIFCSPLOWO2_12_FULL_52_8]
MDENQNPLPDEQKKEEEGMGNTPPTPAPSEDVIYLATESPDARSASGDSLYQTVFHVRVLEWTLHWNINVILSHTSWRPQ